MSASHVDAMAMPSVTIPTLRASTVITGNSIFNKSDNTSFEQAPSVHDDYPTSIDHIEPIAHVPEGGVPHKAWHDCDTVMIDELVADVQSCAQMAQKAGERLRRERAVERHNATGSDPGTPRPATPTKSGAPRSTRGRSPVPITERKPWGANAPTPRRKSSPARTPSSASQTPPTTTKRVPRAAPVSPPVVETPVTKRKPAVPKFGGRSASQSSHPHSIEAVERDIRRRMPGGAASTTEKSLPHTETLKQPAATAPMSTEAALAQHHAALQVESLKLELQATKDENTKLVSRVDKLEAQLASSTEIHTEVERVLTDKVMQLTAQVQYCMRWMEQFDAAALAAEEEAIGNSAAEVDVPESASLQHHMMDYAATATQEDVEPHDDNDVITTASSSEEAEMEIPAIPVVRKLDLSESSSVNMSAAKLPPSLPLNLQQE